VRTVHPAPPYSRRPPLCRPGACQPRRLALPACRRRAQKKAGARGRGHSDARMITLGILKVIGVDGAPIEARRQSGMVVLTLSAHSSRSSVSVMPLLHHRTIRQRCRLCMIIRALDAVSADTGQCRHALRPARVIAGHGSATRVVATARNRAPWIGIWRLRVAQLRFAQQRRCYEKKHDDRLARHSFSPCRRSCLFFILASLP
jgi:hypothetical protein